MHDSSIPASRPLPGVGLRKRYSIDIREFLAIEGNSVVRSELEMVYRRLSGNGRSRFLERRRGNFDYRADRVLQHFRRRVRYLTADRRRFDDWQFPEETLARGGGDCEDLAFLLASMLEESGISPHCLRVALGKVIVHRDGARRSHQHVWVMYQNELGAWQIFEPMANVAQAVEARGLRGRGERAASAKGVTAEYVPYFVFNRHHLWRVRVPDLIAAKKLAPYLSERRFWGGFDPGFAIGVHEEILDEALGSGLTAEELAEVKNHNSWVDVNVLAYDPRDHFDFAYVEAGWRRVEQRLAAGTLKGLALAAHGIADFYAHSLYGYFARPRDGRLRLYDPSELSAADLKYDGIFGRLGLPGCKGDAAASAAQWNGSLISGQWWRWFTTYPKALKDAAELRRRRCLPDHDMLAVDSAHNHHAGKHLYAADEYAEQFPLRRDAAVRHIRRAFAHWKHSG